MPNTRCLSLSCIPFSPEAIHQALKAFSEYQGNQSEFIVKSQMSLSVCFPRKKGNVTIKKAKKDTARLDTSSLKEYFLKIIR